MAIVAKYPPWYTALEAEIGQSEVVGAKSNPRILEYRKMSGILLEGDDSKVPWCAIVINAMLAKVRVKGTGSGLARSFTNSSNFERLSKPCAGCIVVITSTRGAGSGHVFLYKAENELFIQGLGGNQNDSVGIAMFQKSKLVGYYWPKGCQKPLYPFDQPIKISKSFQPATPVRDA